MTVPERIAVRHDDEAIEHGEVARLAARARLVPELERAAPRGLPVLAEVVEDGELSLEVPRAIAVEVRVQREVPAGQREREARAAEMRIGIKPFDPGERGEEVQERHARELGEQMPQRRIDALEARALELAEPRRLLAVVATHPAGVLGARESLGERAGLGLAEKPVEDGVRIGARVAVRVAPLERERAEVLSVEEHASLLATFVALVEWRGHSNRRVSASR